MSQRACRDPRRPPLIDERRLGKRGSPVTGAPRRLDEIANEIIDRLRAKRSEEPR